MNERILCVDDDANILLAYQRQLRKQFEIDTALGGDLGLEALAARGPYAVIVSDMRMPGMDGIQFLAKARAVAPDSVRMMLTGNADQDTAIAAVNEGSIFRFLTKPCPAELFARQLAAGLDQYRLITAERELLEKTLRGGVKVLIEILSLTHPAAFSRALRIQAIVRELAVHLKLPGPWQFELAAMLSQIGCVTLPPDTLDAVYCGQELAEAERQKYARHPAVAGELLASIPRLEPVAQMIARQDEPFSKLKVTAKPSERDPVSVGAQLLKVALGFDQLVHRGMSTQAAIHKMLGQPAEWDPVLVAALEQAEVSESEVETRMVELAHLASGMILDQDVRSNTGLLLVSKGHAVTYPLLERLRNFAQKGAVTERFRVRVPRSMPPPALPDACAAPALGAVGRTARDEQLELAR